MPIHPFIVFGLLVLAATATLELPVNVATAQSKTEAQKLHTRLDAEWEWRLKEFPEFATYVGDNRYNDRLIDLSFEAIERRDRHAHEVAGSLKQIDRGKLGLEDQLNYDLSVLDVTEAIEGQRFPEELIPLTHMNGVQQDIADLTQQIPRFQAKDYEQFIQRLRHVPRLVDQTIALMKKGVAEGITVPRITLREVDDQIAGQIVTNPRESPIYRIVFTDFPSTVSAADRTRLEADGVRAIQEAVVPAYRKLYDFIVKEYEPNARSTVGLSALRDGNDWYTYRVKVMTTTEKSPDEIHDIGRAEVARIRRLMEEVMKESGFKGSLEEFFKFLRTDPQFFFTDKNLLLTTYRDIAKRIDPKLPKLFGKLPRLPYGVVPVPSYSEKTQTTAYYNPGSLEAGRPGLFYANTYDLKSRPKWEMEALTAHEAVPGHHLQIALAQELQNLPQFRRHGSYTAFIEGWALYSESLGPELDLYADPYSKFGQLTYEMWRAIRLVVDTGLHAKGWTRDQAIKFFSDNAGKAEHDILVEVDRYIVWPGQALAYKIGELKIKELRERATQKLGSRFSLREFHDEVLGAGPLPLRMLDQRIERWIQKTVDSR